MTEPFSTDPADVGDMVAGRYRLEALVGQGGMARVFRATDTVLGRQVAVKLLRDGGEVSDTVRARSETHLLAGLNHPSLVTLHDAVLSPDGPSFLVMEFISGQTLRERIADGPLPPPEVAAAAADLAEALHSVHAAGVVHRDIKPSNVLVTPSTLPDREFRVKLADFGIAYLVDTTRLTTPGTVIGTAAYLAPEQVRGEQITPAADIYALGLVLLEALTGERAYPQESGAEAIMARLVAPPDIPASLPRGWRELLAAMTETDASARPRALEVAVAASALPHADRAATVDTAVDTAVVVPPRPPLPSPTQAGRTSGRTLPMAEPEATALLTDESPAPEERIRPQRRRRSWILGAGAAAAGIIALGTGWFAVSSSGTPDPVPTLPTVVEPLGGHLQDLMDEVTP